ncbi:hypothetical protein LZ30DRAFT_312154 [Colletotrichum cereale]|nr:hypothetical protein LZ30DRAFT_312154 [Colletotrichum cereale]
MRTCGNGLHGLAVKRRPSTAEPSSSDLADPSPFSLHVRDTLVSLSWSHGRPAMSPSPLSISSSGHGTSPSSVRFPTRLLRSPTSRLAFPSI